MRVRIGRQKRGVAALVAVALVMSALGALHQGVPAARLSLNDGGVWVINQGLRLAAHLNYPSRTLDGGLRAATDSFDVSQNRNDVLLHDTKALTVQPVDTAMMALGSGASTADGVTSLQGGDVVAMFKQDGGQVWAMRSEELSSFSPTAKPTLELKGAARVVVAQSGTILVVASDGSVKKIVSADASGGFQVSDAGKIPDTTTLDDTEVTAVGDEVALLDRKKGQVRTAKGSVTVPEPNAVALQQPGPASSDVLLAGTASLVRAPMGGGAPVVRNAGKGGQAASGSPTQPVFLAGCAYAAWSGSGEYLRDCPSGADDVTASVDAIKTSTSLSFRVNRDVIVLNNVLSGDVILVNDKMQVVKNWDIIQNQLADQDKNKTDQSKGTEDATRQVKRTEDERPPTAQPDDFGVRPGRTTTLPVLANDTDPDGDVLTATVTKEPNFGTVGRVRGGEALSIEIPQDASGATSLKYKADDGRGGTSAETDAKVTVHPFSQNEAPKSLRASSITLVQGAEQTYNVLADWIDPDGDAIYLSNAVGSTGQRVNFRPDGTVTVKDLGKSASGTFDVSVTVTDGTASATGVIRVTVTASKDLPPVANTDHVQVFKGQQVVVHPLANDIDPNGKKLRLAGVAKPAAKETITGDLINGTFTFSSDDVRSHYVSYLVTNGPQSSTGVVRVDVVDSAAGQPPSVESDMALLPASGSVAVDVLANDSDPGGGVLVIQSVNVPAAAQNITVEVADHATLRVSAPAGLTKQATFNYTVSNGSASATGQVTVVPMPPVATTLAPVAVADAATVRAHDIVSIPVLANDSSPGTLPLTLDPKLTMQGDAAMGDAFVSGKLLRFRAGGKAGQVRVTYTVRDSAENYASAEAVVTVNAGTQNGAPNPQPVVGRVISGATVSIPVPLDGIDPDGDSVSLVGLDKLPSKGTAVVKDGAISYQANDAAVGTDSFTYQVADRYGLSATATVLVGIAPPSAVNQAPVAIAADNVIARPGRKLSVPVTGNDIDPDGDKVSLVADSAAPVDSQTTVKAATNGSRIDVTTPSQPTMMRYYYDISDAHGGLGRGVLTVDVRSDAPLLAPVAKDDALTAADISGKQTVDVDVLANDDDPDGSASDLAVSSTDPGVNVVGSKVRVPITADRQILLYTVTDIDKLTSTAAIVVPGAASEPPSLIASKIPARVKAGELLTIPLGEFVATRSGHSAMLTFEDRIKAGQGWDGSAIVKDAHTLLFRAKKEYTGGSSSLTFEVTDGANPNDTTGQKAMLTIPIIVEPAPEVHTRPTLRPSDITVAALEPAKSVDLSPMVTDPDPGDLAKMTYSIGAASAGFDAKLSGHTLSVSAVDAKSGQIGTVTLTVSDGTTQPVSAQIRLVVTASTRPKMQVTEVVITDAKAGVASPVDLTSHITNPFADQGKPVTLVGQPTVSAGAGNVSASGLNLTITPDATFHGQMVVSYTAQDATLDASRRVQGVVRLTVRAKPDPPSAASATTNASQTATVSWTAGANNGAQITDFTVKWSGGSKSCGQVTSCVITGLQNDTQYTFTVTATNVVGESDPSLPSNSVRPDKKPEPPGTPVAVSGDLQIQLSWAAATTAGSAVTSYSVQISPAAGGVTQKEVTGTSVTWSGLTNGTAYTFQVQAHSKAKDPSDWSGTSSPCIPAGKPFQPVAPVAKPGTTNNLPPSAVVSWSAPDGNGDNNMTYLLYDAGNALVYTGSALSTSVTMAVSTSNQSFHVVAKNRVGESTASQASNAIRPMMSPGTVTGLTVTATGENNTVAVSFGAAPGNGALPSEMAYTWFSEVSPFAKGPIPSGGSVISSSGSLPNGTATRVWVQATSTVGGVSSTGLSMTAPVTSYGPPTSPTMSCSGGDQSVSCSWSGGNANGRTTRYHLWGDGVDTADGGASNSHTFSGIGYSASRTLCVQAVQTMDGGAERTGPQSCKTATSNPAPPQPPPPPSPTVTLSRGTAVSTSTCWTAGCAWINVTTANFGGNVTCKPDGWGYSWPQGPNETKQSNNYYGYTGQVVSVTCNGVQGSLKW